MNHSLDNIEAIKKLDAANLLEKTADLPNQIEKCWADWQKIAIPSHFGTAKSVLIIGMGGSGIGAAIVTNLARENCNIVVETCRDYNIPAWVDKHTLVIATSYSGNTEETLDALRQAAAKTEKLITISTGGKLASIGSRYRALNYIFDYQTQPRAALGYSFTSLLAIFAKLRIMEIKIDEIDEAVTLTKGLISKININMATYLNPAKILAQKIHGRIPIVIGSGLMIEVARRWKQNFNEDAKTISYFEEIPEMNHNSLVGLEFPDDLAKKVFFIILESKYNLSRNKTRENITTQILTKMHIPFETVLLESSVSKIAEIFQMISYGDFTACYLAVLNNVAPDPVAIIDFLKDKLAENTK